MLHDLYSRPFSQVPKPKRSRFRFGFGNGNGGEAVAPDSTKVGLLPQKGWRERNIQFLNNVLIPHLLAPRQPRGQSSIIRGVEAHQTGVTWLGHSGFLLQMGGKNILVDPLWALWLGPLKRASHPSLIARELPYIDLVLITHAHFDHLHLPSLRTIAAGQPIIVPQGVGSVVKRCAFSRIIEMDYWQSLRVLGLDITFTPTKHWGARFIHDTYRKFGGYLISDGHQTVFHCGDSSLFDGFQDIAKRASIDVALMPIGAYQPPSGRPVHMNPEEAIESFEMLGAKHMVPMHYAAYPLSGEPLHEPEERLLKATKLLNLQDRVHVLAEGNQGVF